MLARSKQGRLRLRNVSLAHQITLGSLRFCPLGARRLGQTSSLETWSLRCEAGQSISTDLLLFKSTCSLLYLVWKLQEGFTCLEMSHTLNEITPICECRLMRKCFMTPSLPSGWEPQSDDMSVTAIGKDGTDELRLSHLNRGQEVLARHCRFITKVMQGDCSWK